MRFSFYVLRFHSPRGRALFLLLLTRGMVCGTQWRVACTPTDTLFAQPQCISYKASDSSETLLPPDCPGGLVFDSRSQLCLSGITREPTNGSHNVGAAARLSSGPSNVVNVVLCWPPDLFEVRRGKCRPKRSHEAPPPTLASTPQTPPPSTPFSNALPVDPPSPCPPGLTYKPLCGSVNQPLSRTGCCCGISGCSIVGGPPPPTHHEPNDIGYK